MRDGVHCGRPEDTSSTPPPGHLSDQGRLVACPACGAERIGNTPLICAQHRGDVLHFVTITTQKPHSFDLCFVKVRATNRNLVQNDPGDGVSECGHGFTPYGCMDAVHSQRAGGVTRGRFVAASRPQTGLYSTTCRGRKCQDPLNPDRRLTVTTGAA